MKKNKIRKLLLLSAMAMLFILIMPLTALASDVEINETNFPDETFRNWVIKYCDTNKDNSLSETEINAVTAVYCNRMNITGLDGIEYFTKITALDCAYNNITSIDVSKNTALTRIDCSDNNITSLTVGSGNTKLTYLSCSNNNLTSLDVSTCTALSSLYCYNNNLTTLTIGEKKSLSALNFDNNNLTSLDLSKDTVTSITGSQTDCNNTYYIQPNADNTFDLSSLPDGFDVSKAYGWVGGTVSDNILTIDSGVTTVSYYYNVPLGLNNNCYPYKFILTVPHIAISGTTVSGKAGSEVDVALNLTENTGIASLQVTLDYNTDVLELVNATNGTVFSSDSLLELDLTNNKTHVLSWQNSKLKENITTTGKLATLKFKIKDTAAAGPTTINFLCDSDNDEVQDVKGESMIVNTTAGSVKVIACGDVDADGEEIGIADVTRLRRYVAKWTGYTVNEDTSDLDGNGKITLRDVTILERYIAGWTGYETLPMTTSPLPIG